jgi:hypothetical protein
MAFFTFDRRIIDPILRPWGRTFDWDPEYLETLVWLDASDKQTIILNESNTIDQWSDKSGNGNHFTVPSTWNSPSVFEKGINNLDVIRFVKASKHGLGRARPGNHISFHVVLQRQSADPDSILLSNGGSSGNYWACMANNTSAGSADISSLITYFDGTLISNPNRGQFRTSVNGRIAMWSFSGSLSWTNFYLGGYNNSSWYLTADLAEIIITDGVLSTEDRQKIEGYLAHKWAITANLPSDHPYKTSKPQV